MKEKTEIVFDGYTDIQYRMFDRSILENWLLSIAGWISLPFIYPLVLLAKLSPETGFKIASEFLSLIPTIIGWGPRYEFYRRTLRSCGKNLLVAFGTTFTYPEINIGNNVSIGRNSIIYHCDIGDNVMIGAMVELLSGQKYHNYSRTDIPIIKQGGKLKRIRIGSDIFIGSKSIIMADVGDGAVVGAGSVVTKNVEPYTIVAGNPAQLLKNRLGK